MTVLTQDFVHLINIAFIFGSNFLGQKKHRQILTQRVERPNFTNLYTNRKESTTLTLQRFSYRAKNCFVNLHRCCVIWRRRITMRDFHTVYVRYSYCFFYGVHICFFLLFYGSLSSLVFRFFLPKLSYGRV